MSAKLKRSLDPERLKFPICFQFSILIYFEEGNIGVEQPERNNFKVSA